MRALIIKQHWIDLILNDQKTWEMRSRKTNIRGRIGLIQSGSGLVVGEATLENCFDTRTMYHDYDELPSYSNEHYHRIKDKSLIDKYPFAWVFSNPVRYTEPKPYQHPKGAVVWVKLDGQKDQKMMTTKETFDSIFSGILASSEMEAKQSPLYGYLINNPELINTIDQLWHHILYPQEKELTAAVINIKQIEDNPNRRKFADVYINAMSFYRWNLRYFIEKNEGSACCNDKAMFVLRSYLKYLLDGEIPAWNTENQKYWIPKLGDSALWFDFVDGLYEMYHGRPDKYLAASKKLTKPE